MVDAKVVEHAPRCKPTPDIMNVFSATGIRPRFLC